jgi:hypothetical protein
MITVDRFTWVDNQINGFDRNYLPIHSARSAGGPSASVPEKTLGGT